MGYYDGNLTATSVGSLSDSLPLRADPTHAAD